MTNKSFDQLLTSYLEEDSSPEEYLELIRYIKGGEYDEILKQRIDELLFRKSAETDIDPDRARALLDSILHSEKHAAKLISISLPGKRAFKWVASAAALILVAIGIWWLFSGQMGRENLYESGKLADAQHKPQVSPPNAGGKKYLRLEDGSTVLLNEGSKLEYTPSFNKLTREVTLTGEAYFEIRQDRSKPFIVHTGSVNTTVLGTAFNIKAYPGQKEVVVTVTRGKVKVGKTGSNFRIAGANESVYVNMEINSSRQEKADAEQIVDWKKDCLVLDNISMQEAAVLIGNRYHVNISFSGQGMKACRISATFLNNESLEQVMGVVSEVINAKYAIQPNDQVIISGTGCI